MTTKTASVSGNWSNTATWGGAAVPVDGDIVVINSGVTVLFDVNQYSFTNGLSPLTLNGTLNVSPSAVTCLKMNGNITGTGTFNMGTSTNPIQRAASGLSNRFNLILNATCTIGGINWAAYGWTPTLENTTLSAGAALNATSIVLSQDLGLQPGDQIFIGCGTVLEQLFNEEPPVYTVSAYNSTTKTVTLSSGLKTARLTGDYVVFYSRPILINRTSGAVAIDDGSLGNNIQFNGVLCTSQLLAPSDYTENHVFNHCTFNLGASDQRWCTTSIINSTFNYCSFYNLIAFQSSSLTINNCYLAGPYSLESVTNSILNNCYGQNIYGIQQGMMPGSTNIIKNCIFNSSGGICDGGEIFINVQNLNGASPVTYSSDPSTFGLMNKFKATNCNFTNIQDQYQFYGSYGKLYNCLISAVGTVMLFDVVDRPVWAIVESFDHNQIIGNYAAWMKGGIITTISGKLNFACQSAVYPVFKEYKIRVNKNDIEKFRIIGIKDFTGGIVKAELIDPANDPLIDPTAAPLVSSIMEDTKDISRGMNLSYNVTKNQELILRISVTNSTGNFILRRINWVNGYLVEDIK
jgi:hypothetical protein